MFNTTAPPPCTWLGSDQIIATTIHDNNNNNNNEKAQNKISQNQVNV